MKRGEGHLPFSPEIQGLEFTSQAKPKKVPEFPFS